MSTEEAINVPIEIKFKMMFVLFPADKSANNVVDSWKLNYIYT